MARMLINLKKWNGLKRACILNKESLDIVLADLSVKYESRLKIRRYRHFQISDKATEINELFIQVLS